MFFPVNMVNKSDEIEIDQRGELKHIFNISNAELPLHYHDYIVSLWTQYCKQKFSFFFLNKFTSN